jgi:hypothetical protein
MSDHIDTRFLPPPQRRKFDRKWRDKVSAWNNQVLEAFIHKSELKYVPTIYVIPFHFYSLTPINEHRAYLEHFIGKTAPDPDDRENKFSIYLVFDVIKRAPQEINIANLAHELGHIHSLMKGTAAKPEELLGKSPEEIRQIKEEPVKNIEMSFEEPVKSMILKMEKEKSSNPGVAKVYLGVSLGLPDDKLLEVVLGKNHARELVVKKADEGMRRLGLK